MNTVVCRTAPATPGLLIICKKMFDVFSFQLLPLYTVQILWPQLDRCLERGHLDTPLEHMSLLWEHSFLEHLGADQIL